MVFVFYFRFHKNNLLLKIIIFCFALEQIKSKRKKYMNISAFLFDHQNIAELNGLLPTTVIEIKYKEKCIKNLNRN